MALAVIAEMGEKVELIPPLLFTYPLRAKEAEVGEQVLAVVTLMAAEASAYLAKV